MRRSLPFLWAGLCLLACGAPLVGQEGRIFRKTPDTIGIWEFNDIPGAPGEGLPDDTIIADLSGNGLDARVMANGDGTIAAGEGDDCFGTNTGLDRVGAGFMSRVTVEDDEAFQFGPDEDFSFELYVQRDEAIGGENWGILAGTWHSRTVLDDAVDPTVNGAWYGFGYIRHNEGGGWHLVLSPINEDRTFTPGFNEIQSGVFDIPPGFHYLVTVVDRATETAWVYLDDAIVAQVAIPPGSAFYTPAGYEAEPSHLTFLNGVDDLTRAGGYRPPPSGYTIDAARVISRALTAEEVLVNYFDLLDCLAIPTDAETETQAVLTSTSDNVIVGQCVRLSAANSVAEEGEEIVGYQWKIGDGAFEGGEVTREISFGEPSPANGIPVTVRVTDSAGGSAEATVMIRVSHPMPRAIIDARLAGDELVGSSSILAEGDVVDLDASGSFTPIPA
ncbi:MAG TPA: hypothetical protein VK116_17230, partial [Planctomycetota bacterium]|nr:hypothetical protein [Planctomycetota bacterium]